MDSKCEDPASASECALRRHSSEVGAVCSNSARTDLCGGRSGNRRPYRDKTKTAGQRPTPHARKQLILRCRVGVFACYGSGAVVEPARSMALKRNLYVPWGCPRKVISGAKR